MHTHAYACTHKSGARVFPTKLLTRKKTGLERRKGRAVGSIEGRCRKRKAPRWVRKVGGGEEEEVEEGGGGMVTKRETDLERDGGRRSEGRARETGRGRVKERKRLDRISSLRVTMGGSIEKII